LRKDGKERRQKFPNGEKGKSEGTDEKGEVKKGGIYDPRTHEEQLKSVGPGGAATKTT